MTKLSILISFLLFPFLTVAQSIEPQVVGSAGASYTAPGFSLSWTMGEVAIQTYSQPTSMLTEGFHQGDLQQSTIGVEPEMIDGLTIYPNPAQGSFWIKKDPEAARKLHALELFDLMGRSIMTQQLSTTNANEQVNLAPNIARGIYLIHLLNDQNLVVHTSRIWIQ